MFWRFLYELLIKVLFILIKLVVCLYIHIFIHIKTLCITDYYCEASFLMSGLNDQINFTIFSRYLYTQ